MMFAVNIPVFCQNEEGPQITFEEDNYDFGDITQGEKIDHVFNFKNTGNKPLVISNVLTTCGCTVPSWSKKPIPPGKSSEIKVIFNSTGKMGKQNKVITLFSNSVNQKDRITIQANVIPGY